MTRSAAGGSRDDDPGAPPVGVLVMAYGTPARFEDVEEFYLDVRRGRPPTPEQLEELRRRYAAVGGISELSARTAEQVAGVQAALDRTSPGMFACRYGAKHARPKIEDAVDAFAATGVRRVVGIVLAPHYSSASIGEYVERASSRAAARHMEARFIEDWHDDPALVELLAERVRRSISELRSAGAPGDIELLVTAHSLPMRVIDSGDGYDRRLAETAELVAAAVPASRYRVCWQSAGRTPEPWIGPDVLEVLRAIAAERTAEPPGAVGSVVICPAGFTSDHLEVNYDLD
ncbi:MAG: ferrochelatase, partial [Acidimicrobiales bacterium]